MEFFIFHKEYLHWRKNSSAIFSYYSKKKKLYKSSIDSINIKVKLATVVEGDQKAPFSIATTPRCRGGCYSFPWIAPLYPSYVPYIAEC